MKLLLATAAALSVLALGASAAQAADLTPVVEAPPPFTWTGPYVGIHLGYGWGDESDDQSDLFTGEVDPGDSFNMNGFVGGVHLGYNWQFNQVVLGVEGDFDYANLNGDTDYDYGFGDTGNLEMKSQWQGSLRVRAGYAVDAFLLYATGGVAFADGKLTDSPDFAPSSEDTNTHVGWTIGAGAEYAFTPNWIGRAEVRYTDFGSETYSLNAGDVSASWNQTTVTAGISYKF